MTEEKRVSDLVSISTALADVGQQLDGAESSWNVYGIISDVQQSVLSMQSKAVAHFAMHMDSAALLVAWRTWSQFARSSARKDGKPAPPRLNMPHAAKSNEAKRGVE